MRCGRMCRCRLRRCWMSRCWMCSGWTRSRFGRRPRWGVRWSTRWLIARVAVPLHLQIGYSAICGTVVVITQKQWMLLSRPRQKIVLGVRRSVLLINVRLISACHVRHNMLCVGAPIRMNVVIDVDAQFAMQNISVLFSGAIHSSVTTHYHMHKALPVNPNTRHSDAINISQVNQATCARGKRSAAHHKFHKESVTPNFHRSHHPVPDYRVRSEQLKVIWPFNKVAIA